MMLLLLILRKSMQQAQSFNHIKPNRLPLSSDKGFLYGVRKPEIMILVSLTPLATQEEKEKNYVSILVTVLWKI